MTATTSTTDTAQIETVITTDEGAGVQLSTTALPPLGPGDVLVEVAAAAINPVDRMVASPDRRLLGLEGAVGVGWDVSGVVRGTGAAVTRFSAGDRVAGLHPRLTDASRTHAEAVVLDATWIAPLPDGLDLVDAASVPLNALTALQAVDLLGDGAGRSLLITGAAGAVGGNAITFAAEAGWRVTALARSTDEEFVRTAGAAEIVTEAEPTRYDAVLDTAVLRETALASVVDGGTYVGVMPVMPLKADRGIRSVDVSVEPDAVALGRILARAVAEEIPVRVGGRLPLSDARDGYERAGEPGQRGRWLLLGPAAG